MPFVAPAADELVVRTPMHAVPTVPVMPTMPTVMPAMPALADADCSRAHPPVSGPGRLNGPAGPEAGNGLERA
jgi:hypothetical protein